MANKVLEKINFNGETYNIGLQMDGPEFIVGTWTGATGTWTGVTKESELYDGKQILLYMPFGGSGNATLNLTLSGGGTTGAKNVYFESTTRFTTHKGQNAILHLVYKTALKLSNGTTYEGWWYIANRDTNDTAYYSRDIYSNILAGANKIYPYTILLQLPDGRWESPVLSSSTEATKNPNTNGFVLGQMIGYSRNAAINENNKPETYTLYYTHSLVDYRYSFNLANTNEAKLVTNKPIFLKGTVTNGLFYLDTTRWVTQTLPTSDDGFVYIYLGNAYDWYRGSFADQHPIYWYKNGSIKLFSDYASVAGSANSVAWNNVSGKPSTYTPTSHAHGNISNNGALATADMAVVTDANKQITTANLATSSPTAASTTSTTFIDTISQNSLGKITATKKTLPTASTSVAGIVKLGSGDNDAATGTHVHSYAGSNSPGGSATSAIGFATAKTIALTGNVTGSATGGNGSNGWSIATTIGQGVVTNGMLDNSKITIAGNEISLGGSLTAAALKADLGLNSAMHYIGKATVAITDGSTTNPKVGGNTTTLTAGDVVIDSADSREYVWNGSKWELLGGDSSYKVTQTAVADVAYSGSDTATTFVSAVTQDANGAITVTKRKLPTYNNYVHPTYTSKTSGLYKITVDGTGHVSAATAVEKADITALGIPGSDTHYTTHLYAGASDGNANATTTNGNTYLIVTDNTTARNRIKLAGTGATSVTSDASGNITINSTNTTYTFDGTYNASTNKAATVSTVTNAINALDGNLNSTTPGAGKTLTAFSQTDGKVSATFGNISITKSQISDFPTSMTPTSHAHGNIANGGTMSSTGVALANGDYLLFSDASNSGKIERTSITFDGSTATKALTQKGTWETFNNYSHPTTSGNKHIPSGGSSGQFLGWSADGTAAWVNNPNTDTKVTSVDNHYTPSENTSSALSVDASSTTAAIWNTTSLVTGVNIKRDAKGHVTGVTVDSIKMPVNPNTDTKNTAGSTNSNDKLYLVGATSQAANPQTYSNSEVYTTNGQLDANKVRVAENVTLTYNSTEKTLDFVFA